LTKLPGLVFGFLLLAGACAFADSNSSSQVTASPVPDIKQYEDPSRAVLGPTRYPTFTNCSGDNATCAAWLQKTDPDGPSKAKLPANLISQTDYTAIPGLKITDWEIPAAWRATTKILVTWTVRIEGEVPFPSSSEGYAVWPTLCNYWHGTTTQVFQGGSISTKLYINNIAASSDVFSMTMPDPSGNSHTVTQVYDPTITGSFILTKEFFGGQFPAKIDSLEVRWYNDTSLNIISPAGNPANRIMTIQVIPISEN